jgi:transcriptional antiterminator RfaH
LENILRQPVLKHWYVIYTRPRAEKKVHCQLLEQGIESFLPMHKTMRQWSDRKKMVEVPLFSSYVFVNILPAQYFPVLQTLGVVKFISFEGNAVVIPQKQIDNLFILVSNNIETESTSAVFKPGQQVEVKIGPLSGLKGELIKIRGKNRVLVSIDHLEQNLLVNIPKNYLQ